MGYQEPCLGWARIIRLSRGLNMTMTNTKADRKEHQVLCPKVWIIKIHL